MHCRSSRLLRILTIPLYWTAKTSTLVLTENCGDSAYAKVLRVKRRKFEYRCRTNCWKRATNPLQRSGPWFCYECTGVFDSESRSHFPWDIYQMFIDLNYINNQCRALEECVVMSGFLISCCNWIGDITTASTCAHSDDPYIMFINATTKHHHAKLEITI
jgi:hypothetical protein